MGHVAGNALCPSHDPDEVMPGPRAGKGRGLRFGRPADGPGGAGGVIRSAGMSAWSVRLPNPLASRAGRAYMSRQ